MSDFKKVVVLSDHRATANEAALATPREILLAMIAEIDNGLPVEELVITFDCGYHGTGFKNSTKSLKNAIGLLQVCQLELHYRGCEAS
jgi:hypothetical protein